MPSKLIYFDGQDLRTELVEGFFRALAWNRNDDCLYLVGNKGQVLKAQEDQFVPLSSGRRHNLRAISVNPVDGTALIVGNSGTALLLENGHFTTLRVPTFANLRAVSWNHKGTLALIAGNNGTLLKYSGQGFETVDAGRANLRDISWRPKSNTALISSNCFAEEFIPSPNLFTYDAEHSTTKPVNEGRADLIGVDWQPTGEVALVVGYDVVWHNGVIGSFDGKTLSPIQFENKRVYPVAATWKSSEDTAAIVTATVGAGMAKGMIYLWHQQALNPIYSDEEFFFSDAAWNWNGKILAALASTEARTFNS